MAKKVALTIAALQQQANEEMANWLAEHPTWTVDDDRLVDRSIDIIDGIVGDLSPVALRQLMDANPQLLEVEYGDSGRGTSTVVGAMQDALGFTLQRGLDEFIASVAERDEQAEIERTEVPSNFTTSWLTAQAIKLYERWLDRHPEYRKPYDELSFEEEPVRNEALGQSIKRTLERLSDGQMIDLIQRERSLLDADASNGNDTMRGAIIDGIDSEIYGRLTEWEKQQGLH